MRRGPSVVRLRTDHEKLADSRWCGKNVAKSKQIPQVASHYLGFRVSPSPGSDIS
jgi:hypothetical protein